MNVHLGFEVGTGSPVEIPLAHTFVTGQTQLSGKTTTLRAIVERSGQRALAFVTKRGETFEGRRIPPYLPREGEQPIHWRLVETLLASALGQRAMKYERFWIVNAAKGARSLTDVRENVTRLQLKAKGGASADMYMLLGEYLDLVLPEMRALAASDTLQLQPGLNVMDLATISTQTQAMVIRAALEHINRHEHGVLTVFPEAWEFAPRGRSAPAKDEAIAMARKGAVLGNFLLCDSQDIAGVETTVRQAASVWILGVQRELNELKRTLQMIPTGIKKPKPEDVSTLELGQFWACWGRHAVRVYVQPSWINDHTARAIATGSLPVDRYQQRPRRSKEDDVTDREAKELRDENARLKLENDNLRRRLEALEKADERRVTPDSRERGHQRPAPDAAPASGPTRWTQPSAGSDTPAAVALDVEAIYPELLRRLVADAAKDPTLLKVIASKPELEMRVTRKTIAVDEDSIDGLLAKLIADGFFDQGQTKASALKELAARGRALSPGTLYPAMDRLAALGFFRIQEGKDERSRPRTEYTLVPGMKVNVLEPLEA